MVVRITLYVNKTEIYKFKEKSKVIYNVTFTFCLGNALKYFEKDEQSQISLNVIVYDFSVD